MKKWFEQFGEDKTTDLYLILVFSGLVLYGIYTLLEKLIDKL